MWWSYHRKGCVTGVSQREKFVSAIKKKILSGEWPIGHRLPTERELTKMLNVSRSVVNAGMMELATQGFIKIVPRKWTEVMDYKKEGNLSILESIMNYGNNKIDPQILYNILSSRLLIEKECAYLAALNRVEDDLITFKNILHKEKQIKSNAQVNLDELIRIDFLFHHSIAAASGNMVYTLIIKSFEPIGTKLIHQFYSNSNVLEKVHQYHIKIIKAIEMQNAHEAKEAMEQLLLHGETIINEKYERREELGKRTEKPYQKS